MGVLSSTKTLCILFGAVLTWLSTHTHTHTYLQAMLTEGAKVDAFPSSLSLPASSEPQNFILLAIPQEAGQVNILGEWVWLNSRVTIM